MKTKVEKQFLKMIKKKCREHKVKLILSNTKKITLGENIHVSGYFSDEHKKYELACALKNPEYLGILVHEFSHMEQWVEKIPLWSKADYGTDVDDWLEGKNIKYINRKIDRIKYLELDCEKRAVKNIKKYKLPINIKKYIQKANSYILFYNYIKESRRWSKPGRAPYSEINKALWSLCPDKFMPASYYKKIPKKIYNKFVELDI